MFALGTLSGSAFEASELDLENAGDQDLQSGSSQGLGVSGPRAPADHLALLCDFAMGLHPLHEDPSVWN